MPTELMVHAVHQGGMRVSAGTDGHTVQMDYPLKPGEELVGLTPLQMLLASLAGCSANTLMAVLVRRMQQPVRGMEVHARGLRRDEHPTVFTEITLDFMVRGAGLDPGAVERALAVAKDQLCPVWVMLKAGTPITASFRIIDG